jgi:LAS superfamily LD-carboxypeptidase LdcB
VDLTSVEGLRAAYAGALEREGHLNHALSRVQMECEENKFLFQEAVDCGEQLRLQNNELRVKLDDQLDMVSLLNREVKNLRARNTIYKEEIEDTKLAESESRKALLEITKSNDLARAKLEEQKKLMSSIRDDQALTLSNYDVDVQEVMNMQDSVVLREQRLRRELEQKLNKANIELDNNEQEIKRLKQINEDLEHRLAEIEHRYSEELMRLCFEKAYQDIDYESLLNEVKLQRVQLKEAQEKLISYGADNKFEHRMPSLREDGPSLAEQLESSVVRHSICSEDTEGFESEFYEDEASTEIKKEESEDQAPVAPALPDIIQTYLHITATAVLLHFPNLREKVVTTNCLIELVKSSPFYLYYDLMMHFMYKKKQEKALEEANTAAADKVLPPVESSSWLVRLKSLKQSRTIVRSTKRNSWRETGASKIFLSSASLGSETKPTDRSGNETPADEIPRTTSYMF